MNCVCGHTRSQHRDPGTLYPDAHQNSGGLLSCVLCNCSIYEQDDGTDGPRPLYWGQPERWTL